MKRLEPEILDYYNGEVVSMIVEKYGYNAGTNLERQIMAGQKLQKPGILMG